jgi:hypothetical protein
LTDREEDMLIRLRRSFVRYGDDDWVPSDEDILHELLALLAQCEPIKARILGPADLRDALALILRNRTENEQALARLINTVRPLLICS